MFGKVQRARELGLKMVIVPGSQLHQLPEGLDSTEFAAIVGNLLDNAFEASLRTQEGDKTIELFLSDEGDEVVQRSPTRAAAFLKRCGKKFLNRA